MSKIAALILALPFLMPAAHAKALVSIKQIFEASSAKEKADPHFLKRFHLAPAVDPASGKQVFKITKLQKNSALDRQGYKVGDLIAR